ncbi:MAG: helix-turn-helix domain-containing protein, partial [Pseudohongiellaceae bacterium]
MTKDLYTVQEVADLLGLHVKTVRNYVRDGRLPGTRIGKQYRIGRADLEAFTGKPVSAGIQAPVPTMEVSSVLQMDGVGAEQAQRLSNFLVAA